MAHMPSSLLPSVVTTGVGGSSPAAASRAVAASAGMRIRVGSYQSASDSPRTDPFRTAGDQTTSIHVIAETCRH